MDQMIVDWCAEVRKKTWRALWATEISRSSHRKNLGGLALHLFLHQIHHRGRATHLLSQAGIDFGDTDLPELSPKAQRSGARRPPRAIFVA